MRLKHLLLLLLSIFFVNTITSQSVKFTSDTAYVRELSHYLTRSSHTEVDTAFVNLTNIWKSSKLSSPQKSTIISISNALVKRRVRVFPHFYNYMMFIITETNSKTNSSHFNEWQLIFERFLNDKSFSTSKLNKVFEMILSLDTSNTIFESRSVIWKSMSPGYTIEEANADKLIIGFGEADLICYAKRDSMRIYKTKGQYNLFNNTWTGKGGKLTWEYAGLSKDSVYAILNDYKIDMKRSEFKADSSKLINKKYIKQDLWGLLEMKILANRRGSKSPYPAFTSNNKIDIKNIMPDIDYSGGFKMQGSKLFGSGGKSKSSVLIKKENKVFVKAVSDIFIFDFNKKLIIAKNVKVNVKIAEDSLTHPGVNFTYNQNTSSVKFTRFESNFERSRYLDTYHNMEIDVDLVSFNLKDTLINFRSMPMTKRVALFQSSNYFSKRRYDQLQALDKKNPLSVIASMTGSVDAKLTKQEFANSLKKSKKACNMLIYNLINEGFIDYDNKTEIIQPKQKLFDYIASNYNKKDYDVIIMISKSDSVNAIINLNNKDLKIFGVKPFGLSYNRKVGLSPRNSTVTVKKDLDMEFDGKVDAGLVKLFGEKFKFNYNDFTIKFPKVDSLRFYCKTDSLSADSLPLFERIKSPVEKVTGLVRIDKADNKSGKDTLENYPMLISEKTADVYYDQKVNQDTVYQDKDFYFKTIPFVIDSLNSLTRSSIQLDGTFVSDDIFPDINESLTVQNDASLGFIHNISKTKGIKIYKGKGMYYSTISLDRKGLTGKGRIHYLNTDVYSDDIKFFPDSLNATAKNIKMAKQLSPKTRYPKVVTDSVAVHWEPQNQKMNLLSLNKPHNMFEDRVKFYGTLQLEPKKLNGDGTLFFLGAKLKSEIFHFYDESFDTDTTDFELKVEEEEILPIVAKNVNANVDFKKDQGFFKSNGDNSYVDFKINKYRCYMNYFIWKISKNKIDIGIMSNKQEKVKFANFKRENIDIADTTYTAQELSARSKFVSTDPAKDSLSFHAVSSTFDIDNCIINAKNIKFMKIADIFLFPAANIKIQKDGSMDEIHGAKILTNRQTHLHTFKNVHALVIGAKEYEASGDYQYIDRKESVQQIHFKNITVDENDSTIAEATIDESQKFNLSPEFAYKGNVLLSANKKNLFFDGYTKINHLCNQQLRKKWFAFKSAIQADSIVIPLEERLISADTMKLSNGLFVTKKDSIGIYASFLTPKVRLLDYTIFDIKKGYLRYNDSTNYFEMADSARFVDHKASGNHYSLHKKLCIIVGEGKIHLGVDMGQVQTNIAGTIMHNLDSKETGFEAMMSLDFHFDKNAYKIMAESFNEETTLKAVDLGAKQYQKNLKKIVGYKNAEKYKKGFALYGGYDQIPDSMNTSIFLSNINMKWNNEYGAWVSKGKISISNFKKHQILKTVDGIMEVRRIGKRGVLNLYLEINPGKWFFFNYDDGTLKTCSSEDEYNSKIASIKDKKRSSTSKVTDVPFAFYPANQDAKVNFINEMKERYGYVASKQASEATTDMLDNYSIDDDDVTVDETDKNKKGKKKIKKKKKREEEEEEIEEEEEEESE